MAPLVAALWGLAGGLCVEGLEVYANIHRKKSWSWRKPIPQGMTAFVLSIIIRGAVSTVVAAAFAASGQVSGAFAALGLGIAAPLIVQRLARAVPLTDARSTPERATPAMSPSEVVEGAGDAS